MMLAHNPLDAGALMWPYANANVPGPTANDIGAYPGCVAGGFGVRCIYGDGD